MYRLEKLGWPLAARLQSTSSPNTPADTPSINADDAIDLFALGHDAHASLLRDTDTALGPSSPVGSFLLLRLELAQWLLEQVEPTVVQSWPRDAAMDYEAQRNERTLMMRLKRLLAICTFLGLMPPLPSSCTDGGLSILSGGSGLELQLRFFHRLLDQLDARHSMDPFHASVDQYSNVASYAPHTDTNFHRHIRMLHLALAAGAGKATSQTATNGIENLGVERLTLFPPTLMMAATAYRQMKEKQSGMVMKKVPDPSALTAQVEQLHSELSEKRSLVDEMQAQHPLSSREDFLPALEKLEENLKAFTHLTTQFINAEDEGDGDLDMLVERVLQQEERQKSHATSTSGSYSATSFIQDSFGFSSPSHYRLQRQQQQSQQPSPLDQPSWISTLANVVERKRVLESLLQCATNIRREYKRMMQQETKEEIKRLTASKPDDRTTLRLNEIRRVLEASIRRIQKWTEKEQTKEKEKQRQHESNEEKEQQEPSSFGAPPSMPRSNSLLHGSPSLSTSVVTSSTPAPLSSSSLSSSTAYATPSLSSSSSLLASASHPHPHHRSRSILTSSVDLSLPHEHERLGQGSAGMFSPLKSRAIDETNTQQQRHRHASSRSSGSIGSLSGNEPASTPDMTR